MTNMSKPLQLYRIDASLIQHVLTANFLISAAIIWRSDLVLSRNADMNALSVDLSRFLQRISDINQDFC